MSRVEKRECRISQRKSQQYTAFKNKKNLSCKTKWKKSLQRAAKHLPVKRQRKGQGELHAHHLWSLKPLAGSSDYSKWCTITRTKNKASTLWLVICMLNQKEIGSELGTHKRDGQ